MGNFHRLISNNILNNYIKTEQRWQKYFLLFWVFAYDSKSCRPAGGCKNLVKKCLGEIGVIIVFMKERAFDVY